MPRRDYSPPYLGSSDLSPVAANINNPVLIILMQCYECECRDLASLAVRDPCNMSCHSAIGRWYDSKELSSIMSPLFTASSIGTVIPDAAYLKVRVSVVLQNHAVVL